MRKTQIAEIHYKRTVTSTAIDAIGRYRPGARGRVAQSECTELVAVIPYNALEDALQLVQL